MSNPDEVTELYVGDGYSVLVAEDRQPGVVLSAEFLHNLAPVLGAAYARVLSLSPGQDVNAMRHLCEKLRPVMTHYEQSVREWIASEPLPNGFEAAHAELEEVRRMLDEWK